MDTSNLSLHHVLQILKKRKSEFMESYGITDIGVFGSIARGDATLQSDVDVVVRMTKPDIFFMVHIKETLEKDLHCSVDIIRFRERMNPFLKTRIEKEAVYA